VLFDRLTKVLVDAIVFFCGKDHLSELASIDIHTGINDLRRPMNLA
jgi:hypothetical protein